MDRCASRTTLLGTAANALHANRKSHRHAGSVEGCRGIFFWTSDAEARNLFRFFFVDWYECDGVELGRLFLVGGFFLKLGFTVGLLIGHRQQPNHGWRKNKAREAGEAILVTM